MTASPTLNDAAFAIRGGQFDRAAEILGRLVDASPDEFEPRWLLLHCLEQVRDFDALRRHLDELSRRAWANAEHLNAVAEFARQRGYPLDGIVRAYRRRHERAPGDPTPSYNLAYYLAAHHEYEAALEYYREALELGIRSPEEVHLNIANLHMDRLDDPAQAGQHLEQALEINPRYVQAHFNLGNLAERRGDRAEAERRFLECLALEPGHHTALARLADAHRFTDLEDGLLKRLKAASERSRHADLHFALGRAYEQVGEYGAAWSAFSRGNSIDREQRQAYDPAREEARLQAIIDTFDAAWLDRFRGESHGALFICGMFRSGSTLLERILGAHPALTAGGESEFFPSVVAGYARDFPRDALRLQPEFIESLRERHRTVCERRAEPGTRLIDKRPDNVLYAGLIKAVVPGATFIVTERDWRDVAVSVYGTRLGPTQGYATRLRDIRHHEALQRRLVDHWESLFEGDLSRVPYEALVQSPRETLGDVLGYLGEDWNDACLAFDRQGGTVATASAWQVREPLHDRSVGRWRHYADAFRDVFGDESFDD